MLIRKALPDDIEQIMSIYAAGKKFMDATGNPTQWKVGYPTREMVINDIAKGESFLLCDETGPHAVFAFILGEDPTYSYIEDGSWKNDLPYGTIHRVASDGKYSKVFDRCFEYCRGVLNNLRCDTHHDNKPMQKALERNGFKRCGIIYVGDGTPRIAYQYTEN